MNGFKPSGLSILFAFLLTLLAAGIAPSALADEDPAAKLHDLLDAFLAGASVNDVEMHDRFWAEDLIYTSSSGERFGKAAIMQGLEQAPEDDSEAPVYSSEDVRIRVFDEIAVVTFRLVATELADDTRAEYFNTGVFRNLDGLWQAFTWQATKIPETGE
ncbi:MAG: nuclear transport factor 2 family protein [Wenzhouxiangellaceae bacterium]|nr:nuclear transport factor 2 family protein [Wenzhouxiangellaceae bacterium]